MYRIQRLILLTLEPVHIGTGGARLGRVDLSIVREPGTSLPKIPGTSLSGALRHYAAYRAGRPQCAGKKNPCGRPDCPVCYTFGTANEAGGGWRGTVAVGDARLLLFPVRSMQGPVWVTSPEALEEAGLPKPPIPTESAWVTGGLASGHLNLGWLMLPVRPLETPLALPEEIPEAVARRVVVLPQDLFIHVVNSNLEVRTSVSIDPETGAAEEGALFTYEAIPRAAYLWLEVIEDDFRGAFPADSNLNPEGWTSSLDVVMAGFEWMAALGVGGMNTRGFGRVRCLTPWPQVDFPAAGGEG